MKINYKNTALGLIDDPKNFHFGFPDPDITPKFTPAELTEFGNSIIKSAPILKKLCGDNIEYVSSSFFEAYKKGANKLTNILYNEEVEDSGILITGGFTDGCTHVHTIYYTVCTIRINGNLHYNVMFIDFTKHAKVDEHALDVYVTQRAVPEQSIVETKSLIWNGHIDIGRDDTYWQSFIISFCLFKKYCDIETKVIEPKNRRAKVAGKKYVNETDKRINILDCTWFTNLVISGEFEVEGHLHWYWTGPGRSIKRLRWVSTYEKKGYTRKAKVLIQNENKIH